MKRFLSLVVCIGLFFTSLIFNFPVYGYYTNMPASVVLGQPDFASNSTNQGGNATASTFNLPTFPIKIGSKFLVSDFQNHRILVYNNVPTTNNPVADVIIGQQNFSGTSINQGSSVGANTLKFPSSLATDGTKIFVTDEQNNRVLIFNQVPTSNNASADVVIGQTSMTTASGGTTQSTTNFPFGVFYDGDSGKLVITEYGNNRVLIFNSIPTSNGVSADVVVGQTNFVGNGINQGGSPAANTLNHPEYAIIANGKLIVSDSENNRILIWNSVPTSNNASADIVIGQTNFTSNSANQGGSATANTFNLAGPVTYDGKRLFIVDRNNNRLLIFNNVPTSNNASADIVIGQTNFTSNSANQGNGSSNSQGQNVAFGVFLTESSLYLGDTSNNRVLIFDNIFKYPQVNINTPIVSPNSSSFLRMTGRAAVDGPYQITSVQYSVNGSEMKGADTSAVDGNQSMKDFSFDFDPKANYYQGDGYTVRVRTFTNNTANLDNVFYFTPFTLNRLINSTNTLPSFSFSVNKGRIQDLKDNLSNFRVLVKKDTDKEYTTYIDNIPMDFGSVKDSLSNLQRTNSTNNTSTGTGVYEDTKILVNYSNLNTTFATKSKTPLSPGNYQVKIQAVDKAGRVEDSNIITTSILKRTIPVSTAFVIPAPFQTTIPAAKATPFPGPTVTTIPTPTPSPKTCFLFWCW